VPELSHWPAIAVSISTTVGGIHVTVVEHIRDTRTLR
jgi:hypothetical protein